MNNTIRQVMRHAPVARAIVAASLVLIVGLVQAQTIYRIVGPDGKISFSDKPPVSSANVTPVGAGGKAASTSGPALPFELRQVATKFPVTLYTSSNCAPCGAGRAMLNGRGIPFEEKTINTTEDVQALQRISGASSLPFLTIGGQQIKGYSDSEWTQFLDAAGYPKASALPTGYRYPAVAPLVAVKTPAPAVKPPEAPPQPAPAQPSAAPVDSSANPAGIKF